jgi:hypothetical protein
VDDLAGRWDTQDLLFPDGQELWPPPQAHAAGDAVEQIRAYGMATRLKSRYHRLSSPYTLRQLTLRQIQVGAQAHDSGCNVRVRILLVDTRQKVRIGPPGSQLIKKRTMTTTPVSLLSAHHLSTS